MRCGISPSRCCRRIRKGIKAAGGGAPTTGRCSRRSCMCRSRHGCSWRNVPGSFPLHWRTAHRRFAEWVSLGVMTALHQAVLDVFGAPGQIDWSRASIDAMPGSKIHAVNDRGGLPLHVDISAANINDHLMFQDMVDGLKPVRQRIGRPRETAAEAARRQGLRLPDLYCGRATSPRGSPARASSPRPGSASTATSSNAAWSGPPGSGAWSAATNARLPTS
jgi:hypothetical protein